MKRISTHKKGAKTSRISLHRGFILSILCILLPGCINNTQSSDYPAGPGLQKIANPVSMSGKGTQSALLIVTMDEFETKINGKENLKNNNANGINAATDKGTTQLVNFPNQNPPLIFDLHTDMHDRNEEENVINITFPELMRVVLMLLFVVLII